VGDFDLTGEVRVHAPGDPTSPPPTGYRFGGLVVRDPVEAAPGTHEWCPVAAGAGGPGEPSGVEWKQTHDSVSQWSIVPTPDTHRELRLLREGATITAWHRDPGATEWIPVQTYAFPDLPSTVQVGAMVYSDDPTPQVVARFAWLALAAPAR